MPNPANSERNTRVAPLKTYIPVTFLFLAWAFFELSGGFGFEPMQREATLNEAGDDTGVAALEASLAEALAETHAPMPANASDDNPAPEAAEPESADAAFAVTGTLSEALSDGISVTTLDAGLDADSAFAFDPEPAAPPAITFESLVQPDAITIGEPVGDPINLLTATPLPSADLRVVAGSRVNMRAGPGTDFDVLETLDQGTRTEVLEVDASGWARIRVVESGLEGWIAERLLAEAVN